MATTCLVPKLKKDIETGDLLTPESESDIATGDLLGATAKVDIDTGDLLVSEDQADIETGALLGAQTKVDIDTGDLLTPEDSEDIVTGSLLSTQAKVDIDTGALLGAESVADIVTGSLLVAEAEADIVTGNLLGSLATNGLPRLLCPLVNIDFALGTYAQCGQPISFYDLFTYSRASLGTFINRETKCTGGWNYFVDTAPIDSLRIEFDPETGENLGALIEGSSTNLALRSEEFNDGVWTKTRASVASNDVLAPDNTVSADKLVEDSTASSTHHVGRNITVTSSSEVTASAYVKAAERSEFVLRDSATGLNAFFNLTTGVIDSQSGGLISAAMVPLKNGWFRCSMSFEVDASLSTIQNMTALNGDFTYNGDGASGLYIWGAQLEELPFASSYIKTEGSTVSRSADVLSIGESAISTQDFSFNVVFDVLGLSSFPSVFNYTGSNGTEARLHLGDETNETNTRLGSGQTSTSNQITANINHQSSGVLSGGQLLSYQNGEFTQSDTSNHIQLSSNDVFIGSSASNSRVLYGHISKFATYDLALTAQEVALL